MKHDIAELDLSVRAYNCLKQAGIHYVEDVSEMSDADLLAVRHLGIRCLHEVREKVAACEHGMSERDQLKAENARLKQELEAVGTAAYLYGRTDLADENAKLRELVQDYDAMLAIAAKKEAATSIILPLDAVVNALRIRAGLLGIEVDE